MESKLYNMKGENVGTFAKRVERLVSFPRHNEQFACMVRDLPAN